MRNQYTSTFEQDYPCRAQIIRCKADRDAASMDDYRYCWNTLQSSAKTSYTGFAISASGRRHGF